MDKIDVSFAINASDMSGYVLFVKNGTIKIIDRFGNAVCIFRLSDFMNEVGGSVNAYPCTCCGAGWATVSTQGCKSCHDDCEKLKEYYRKRYG